MVKIIGKIKLRVTYFGYVVTVDVTIMYTNFQIKLQVLLNVLVQLCSYLSKWSETYRLYWGWCEDHYYKIWSYSDEIKFLVKFRDVRSF